MPNNTVKDRNVVFRIVTDRIVNMLQQGQIPWERPFITSLNASRGYDMKPGDTYTGINRFLIPVPGEYLTRRMVEKYHGEIINDRDYWIATWYAQVPNRAADDEEPAGTHPAFRYYPVYHISNVTGIRSRLEGREESAIRSNVNADYLVETFRELSGFGIRTDDSVREPEYDVDYDCAVLPARRKFVNDESYYSALFYGLALSGWKHLNDKARVRTASDTATEDGEYTCEKLIAEMGASMLMSYCGMDTSRVVRNNAARIQGWITALGADVRLVEIAAKQAEKTVRFILATMPELEASPVQAVA